MVQERRSIDLGNIWLFSACSGGQLRSIRRVVEEVVVEAGRILCKEGAPGREFFFILDGTASVRRKGRKVATLGPGQYFGELSLLDRAPRSATVASDTPMTLLVLEERRFHGLIDAMPAISHKLLAAMAARLREADGKALG